MFYENFLALCNKKSIKPSRVASETGFNKGSISVWKRNYNAGKVVSPDTRIVQKIADYFEISVDELLGNEKKTADNDSLKSEVLEIAEKLNNLPQDKLNMIKAYLAGLTATNHED